MTWATWATLAASTAAKYQATQKSNQAMANVQTMEAERQKKLRDEADAALNANIGKSGVTDVNTEIESEKGKRVADLNNAVSLASSTPQGPAADLGVSAGNRLVQSDTGARASETAAQNKSLANAMASMGGFGGTMQSIGQRNVRNLQDQGRLGGFMQGSSGVAGLENEMASHAGDNLKTIGDILGAVSVLSGGYAANGTTPWMSAAERAAATTANAAKTGVTAGQVANTAATAAPAFTLFGKPAPVVRGSSIRGGLNYNPSTGKWE